LRDADWIRRILLNAVVDAEIRLEESFPRTWHCEAELLSWGEGRKRRIDEAGEDEETTREVQGKRWKL
jgi:hypothetical protein